MFGLFGQKEKSDDTPSTLVIRSQDIDLNKFKEKHIVKMREAFPGVSDDVLARYLIARNGDSVKAIEQLQRALDYKALHYPILKSTCLKEVNSGKLYIRGTDKEGRPLLIYRSKNSFPNDRDLEEAARMLVWFGEHVQKRMPPNMSKYTLLIDRVGHKSENTDMELVKHVSSQFQDLFPETLLRAVIYPSDLLFYSIWAIAKWFVDPVTREKVQPMMYLSGVEQFIDRQYIPKSMGGDDEYEYSGDDFEDPYTPEELAAYAAASTANTEVVKAEPVTPPPTATEVPETVFEKVTA